MNIISNTCIGSYIMRDCLKQPYENPFCWNIIDAESMYNLIKNYDKINFKNYELKKDDKWNFWIEIDNQVKVKFVHYHFSSRDTKIRKNNVDLFYNRIWEYIIDCYEKRLSRMKDKPIFIIATSFPHDFYSEEEIKKICSIETPYKIVICNNHIKLNTPHIFLDTKLFENNEQLAKDIWEQINEKI